MSWKLAAKNLQRNRRRSISTALSICVGFVALNLLGAYILRSFETLRVMSVYLDQRGHLQIRKSGSVDGFDSKPQEFLLSQKEQDEIKEKVIASMGDLVEFTGRNLSASGLLSNGQKSHPIYASGFDANAYFRALKHPMTLEHGIFFLLDWQKEHAEQFLSNPELIAITPMIHEIMNFSKPLMLNPSVQIAGLTVEGDLNAVNADLGAIHSTGAEFLESTVILAPIEKVQELLGTDGVQAMTLFLKDFSSLPQASAVMSKLSQKLSFAVEVFSFEDPRINEYFQGSMGFLYVMGGFFLILICTAVSLAIVNSLTMGIIERTREIGTLRAIGFRFRDVRNLFLKENILLAISAIFVGTLLSQLITEIVNRSGIYFEPPGTPNEIPFNLLWSYSIALFATLVLVFVTVASAFVVVTRKLRVKLINLLHDLGD
jgi:putative ABC transport system permease protein